MKKRFLFILPFIMTIGLSSAIKEHTFATHAEEVEVSETEENGLSEEEKSALSEIKSKLSEKLDRELVENIIKWCFDSGILLALLGVYIKYRKAKFKTVEDLADLLKELVGKYIKENFEKLSSEEIKSLTNGLDKVEKSTETIMKVLVLMQDNTKQGKIALLDFLGSKTDNKEVKEASKEVTEELEKQEAKDAEVKKEVENDYEKIF